MEDVAEIINQFDNFPNQYLAQADKLLWLPFLERDCGIIGIIMPFFRYTFFGKQFPLEAFNYMLRFFPHVCCSYPKFDT